MEGKVTNDGRYFVEMPDGTTKESFRIVAYPMAGVVNDKHLPKHCAWLNFTLVPRKNDSFAGKFSIGCHYKKDGQKLNFHFDLPFYVIVEMMKIRFAIKGLPSASEVFSDTDEIKRIGNKLEVTPFAEWLMENGTDKIKRDIANAEMN